MLRPSFSNKYFVISTKTELKIFKSNTLELFHSLDVRSSAYFISDEFIIFSEKGNLYYSSLLEDELIIEEIETFSTKITFISLINKILSICTETGDVLVYLFNYPAKEEIISFSHIAPIKRVYSDGNVTFINDFRNKLKLLPINKEYDNIEEIYFCNYLFAVERKNLFCYNKNSFAVIIQCPEEIKDVTFSKNGSVVFLQSQKNIYVYDFNKEKLLRKISLEIKTQKDSDTSTYSENIFENNKKGYRSKSIIDSSEEISDEIENTKEYFTSFVFNEEDNSLILIKETEFCKIKNATTSLGNKILEKKMKEVIFEKANYEENYVFLEEKENRETGRLKKNKNKKVILTTEFVKPNEEGLAFDNGHFNKLTINNKHSDKLEKMFEEDSLEDQEISESVSSVKNIKKAATAKIIFKNEKLSLLDYNFFGYLTSLQGKEAFFVNLISHDKEIFPYKIIDRNKCRIGAFYKQNVVLANGEFPNKFCFYSHEKQWTNEITDEILFVSLSNKLITLGTKNILYIFNYENEEIINFYFENITLLSSNDTQIFVVESNKLNVINVQNEFSSQLYFLTGIPNWINSDSNKIFYSLKINDKENVFMLKNGLSEKVCEFVGIPLSVKDNYIISLVSFDIEPFIEYNSMNIRDRIIPERKIEVINEELEVKEEPEFKREVFFKSKRFSPFKKK